MAILARRLTEFPVEKKYVDLAVQKGGVPEVKGCVEHFGAKWEIIKDARVNRRDFAVVWLDLTNAYGAVVSTACVDCKSTPFLQRAL